MLRYVRERDNYPKMIYDLWAFMRNDDKILDENIFFPIQMISIFNKKEIFKFPRIFNVKNPNCIMGKNLHLFL